MIGFQPVIPISGYSGWKFLERTNESQKASFERSPELARNIEYFKENIGKADTVEKLISDRRLLSVALGAFGLGDDLDKKAYVKKVLAEGTDDPQAFANRMVDNRYEQLAKEFGYGNLLGSRVGLSGFATKIIEKYKVREYEIAVGETNQNMRLAMTFEREIAGIASLENENSAWFQIMGNPPLRSVVESAFNLPTSFGTLDVDVQKGILKDYARKRFGSADPSIFKDPENIDKMLRSFFLKKQIEEGPGANVPGSTALSILSNTAAGMSNLFQAFY